MIRAATSPGEVQIAVVRDRTLLDYALWRPGAPDGVGDLHRGRLVAQVPGMAGAFVALTDSEGFLPDTEGAKGMAAGTILGVRITRAAQGSKGPRLTARLTDDEQSLCGHGPTALVRRGPDPLMRLASRHPDAPVAVDDLALAAALHAILGRRVTAVQTAFDDEVAAAIDGLAAPVVTLPNGASLSIWPTPALVAIDIDAGSAVSASSSSRRTHTLLNRAMLPALAAQIRLRNLSGGIVIDLAGLPASKRGQLAPDLMRALADDPLRPKFLGFTAMGLAEVVRARVHPPLHELLAGPLAAGLAAIRMVLATMDDNPRSMPVLRAAPPVVTALRDDPVALADLARRTGRNIILRSDPSLPATAWALETDHG